MLQFINLRPPLNSIASFSGDLSSLTAPPFILSPTSLTEFPGKYLHFALILNPYSSVFIDPAYWCERPDVFAAIAEAEPGQDRILAVLKWFISTLKDQYTSRNDQLGSEKKSASCLIFPVSFPETHFEYRPLNPVLGECATSFLLY